FQNVQNDRYDRDDHIQIPQSSHRRPLPRPSPNNHLPHLNRPPRPNPQKHHNNQPKRNNRSNSKKPPNNSPQLPKLPSPLHSIPIILKDNYTTPTLRTTAGVKALTITTNTQSTILTRLKAAGAIIIGKANLHEFALQGITLSSVLGQTLNPYDTSRTPGGSSGGTAAAIAARFALAGCGTDTVNSLRSPASACGIVGFRPSTSRIPTDGIVPVSLTQDTAGPMATCVSDTRILYRVMAGLPVSISQSSESAPPPENSRRMKVGILESFFGTEGLEGAEAKTENEIVQSVIRNALESMAKDIELVSIPEASHPDWSFKTLASKGDTQAFEFKHCLDTFLQSDDVDSEYRSLESIARSGLYSREAVTEVFSASLEEPERYSVDSAEYLERLGYIDGVRGCVERCFEEFGIDAFVYPHQRQFPVRIGGRRQDGRNGILAALTGRPAICIPAGRSPRSEAAPMGIPIGIEFMGKRWGEDDLLDLAERVERILQVKQVPDIRIFEKAEE
ncbi:Amidase, partial [Penicillium brevicompactum]